MITPFLLRRHSGVAALFILLSSLFARALPTAVNDGYTTAEDTPLTVSGGSGTIALSDVFAANISGWTYANNIFGGTNTTGTNSGVWSGTVGNPPGGLTMTRAFAGVSQGTRSGGFSKGFTLAAAQTVRISLDTQVTVTNGGASTVAAVQSRIGTAAPPTELVRQTGNGTMAWQTVSYTAVLAAGTYTLQIGVFCSNGANASSLVLFDNLKVETDGGGGGGGGLLANDTGTAPVTAVKDTDPLHGTVSVSSDGSFTYTPAANYFGADSFTYHASDSTGNSTPATVSLTVTGVNDTPVANNDSYTGTEDTALNITAPGLLANDTDPDGNTLTPALRSPAGKGTVVINANGGFTYTPNANTNGADSFTYRINDGTVNSNDATVSLTINAVNDAPVAQADAYSTSVNTPLNVTLTDPTGQPTTTVTLIKPGTTVPLGDPAEVDLPLWRYLDNGTDQGTAWHAPAFDDSLWLTGKAELGYGDTADGRPERTMVGFGPNAAAKYPTTYFRTTFTVADKATLSTLKLLLLRDDAAAIYLNGTPLLVENLPAGYNYLSFSSANAEDLALVDRTADMNTFLGATIASSLLVEGVNTLAVEIHQTTASSSDISMDIQLTAERGPYAGVLHNDSDPDGTTPTAALVTGPTSGSLTLNPNGTFLYTPAAGFTGLTTFVYRATDGTLNSANTTATITVASAGNAPPTAANDAYATNEDTPLNVAAPGVLTNDSDPENGALTAQVLTQPAHGTLTLNGDGSFLYTPVLNYNGPDAFTYRARDPFNTNSAAATVALTVTAVNDAPVAFADSYGTDVGVTLNVPAAGVLANDTDVDNATLTAQLVSGPVSGTLNLAANGSFTYAPPAGFAGTRTFTYRASDGTATSNTVTVTINIQGAPVANADSYSTAEDTPLTIAAAGVLTNDTDPQSLPITAVNATQPAHGSVSLNTNGSFTYTPAANYAGSDSFTYQASNGARTSAPATVSLTVSPVNDAPVAQNDSYAGTPGQILSIAAPGILTNDSDAEGSPLTLTQLSSPLNGTLTLSADGSFTYTPLPAFSGTDSFTYRISDGSLNSATATVTLTIAQSGADLVISEIFYRPGSAYPENTALEWIELYNRGTTTVDLTGWTISSGVAFAFPAGRTITPGSYLVIAASLASFQAAHPGITNVIGGWSGTLSNGGDTIALTDGFGNGQDQVSYYNEGDWATRSREVTFNGWAWTTTADGGNRSMELRNPAISNDNGQNWSPSGTLGGTPGAVNDTLTNNIPPIIKAVKHSPAVPVSTDRVRISCQLNDESPFSALTATLFWRNATTTSPPAFSSIPMSQDGQGEWFAKLDPQANLTIIEFYLSASDGVNTRTWPAPTSEGQNANCQYQVSNEVASTTAETYRLTLTAAENAAYVTTTGLDSSGNKVDRQFNTTLIVTRGQESSIFYRSDTRIRGNSSRDYTIGGQNITPLRVSLPAGDSLGNTSKFNLNPKAAHLQHFGMRLFQAAGIRTPDSFGVELRRNGVEYTTSSGSTPDFGLWARIEDVSGEMIGNHWKLPGTNSGGTYKKGRPDNYWRNTTAIPSNPDAIWDGWYKQNNADANDWTDLTGFCSVWQTACDPHFTTSAPDVAAAGSASTSGNGAWDTSAAANNGVFTATEMTTLDTVADLDQWAKWFAIMTILQDYETNISNGQDDDYAIYFEPRTVGATVQRRLQIIPHDLDTIFGLGDSSAAFNAVGLYDSTESGSVFRPLLPLLGTTAVAGNAAFRTKYFDALRMLLGTVFDADTTSNSNPPFYQLVDQHLGNWVPAATRTTIKDFVRQRRTYLLGLIAAGATTPPVATSNATVTSARGTLFISEVLANNVSAHANGATFPDVIELQNTGAALVTLTGMSLTDDPLVKAKYVFPAGATIAAGARLVIYADSAVAPGTHTGFGLDNDGGVLSLYNTVASGQALVDGLTYGLQAPNLSIGRTGAALDTWALCTPTIGTANSAVAALAAPSGLRINEWLGNADYRAADDFIELYNGAAQPVALGGMSLTDDFINYPSRPLPPLSFMSAGQFIAFTAKGSSATPGNARELPFNISSSVGHVALLGANATLVDRGDTVPQFRDVSLGRLPDGTGAFTQLAPPSPGSTNAPLSDNSLALLASLRITELMYHAAFSTQSDYIELRNISDLLGAPVTLDLSGVTFTNGITFTFPAGTTLAAGAFVVLVENSTRFTSQFPSIPVGGLYTGTLSNSGERLRFILPDANIAILDFNYKDGWYPSTDGGGDALQIASATASPAMWDGSEGWQAGPPSPGSVPPYSVYAGADLTAPAGVPVFLDGALIPGTFLPSGITIVWTRDSGPGPVTFTTAACEDANATFSAPGVYVLRLTATAAGPTTVTDLVTVTVFETYDTWAARVLASQSPANRLPLADPDKDGASNLAEYALNGNPLNGGSTGQPLPVPGGGVLAFTWQRNLLADPAIQTIPQYSTELITWQEGPIFLTTSLTSTAGNVQNWLTTEAPTSGSPGRAFARILIVMP